jgi:hypothetical protein
MAMEKIAVTGTIGAIPKISQNGKTGITLPPNDSSELANVSFRPPYIDCYTKTVEKRTRVFVGDSHEWKSIIDNISNTQSEYAIEESF